MGVKCKYVFVQDCSVEKAFTVFTNNVPCGRGGASCVSTIKVQLHGKEILFTSAVGLVRIDGASFRKFPVVGEGIFKLMNIVCWWCAIVHQLRFKE